MIQRIQSVYLFLTAAISVFIFQSDFLSFTGPTGNKIILDLHGLSTSGPGGSPEALKSLIPYSYLLLLIPALSLVCIFLFRNRKLQMKLVLVLILLILVLICFLAGYSGFVIREYSAGLKMTITLFLPILMIILSWLAYRGIRKDEKLVRSYDRMR